MQREDFKAQARLHRALGNEARLMIIQQLRRCERSAGDLTRAVGLDQSTVSRHLAVLLAARIVENRKESNVIFYRLLTPCVLEMFSCTTRVLNGNKGGGGCE